MFTSTTELQAVARVSELEPLVGRLERCLQDMAAAMGQRESNALEMAAQHLQRQLAQTLGDFQRAARQGGVPPDLRRRLILAAGQVAVQREALARATASMDRAIEAMLPGAVNPAVYSGQAGSTLRSSGYGIQA